MPALINPRYESQAFRGTYEVTSANKTIAFNNGTTPFTYNIAENAQYVWGLSEGINNVTGAMERQLKLALDAAIAHYAATSITGTPNNVRINADGLVEIEYNCDQVVANLVMYPSANGGTMDPTWFGCVDVFDLSGAPDTYQSQHIPYANWIPGIFNERDTGDYEVTPVSESVTITGRPSYLRWADTFIKRYIKWKTVPGARVKKSRAEEQSFCDTAQFFLDNTHATLEGFKEFLIDGDGTSLKGIVVVFEDVPSGSDYSGIYYVNLRESMIMEEINDSSLVDDSAMEMFSVSLSLRRYGG